MKNTIDASRTLCRDYNLFRDYAPINVRPAGGEAGQGGGI